MTIWKIGKRFLYAQEGVLLAEHALLIALISAVAFVSVQLLGVAIAGVWTGTLSQWP